MSKRLMSISSHLRSSCWPRIPRAQLGAGLYCRCQSHWCRRNERWSGGYHMDITECARVERSNGRNSRDVDDETEVFLAEWVKRNWTPIDSIVKARQADSILTSSLSPVGHCPQRGWLNHPMGSPSLTVSTRLTITLLDERPRHIYTFHNDSVIFGGSDAVRPSSV